VFGGSSRNDYHPEIAEFPFASSPRFVRSHAINLHKRKVFLSPLEKSSYEEMLPEQLIEDPRQTPTLKLNQTSTSSSETEKPSECCIWEESPTIAKFYSLFFNYLAPCSQFIWQNYKGKSSQTKLAQDALRASQAPLG